MHTPALTATLLTLLLSAVPTTLAAPVASARNLALLDTTSSTSGETAAAEPLDARAPQEFVEDVEPLELTSEELESIELPDLSIKPPVHINSFASLSECENLVGSRCLD